MMSRVKRGFSAWEKSNDLQELSSILVDEPTIDYKFFTQTTHSRMDMGVGNIAFYEAVLFELSRFLSED